MKYNVKIPKTLKVGYQERPDTYTKKLAFVVYEENGKITKEKSWRNWIKDEDYETTEYSDGKYVKVIKPGIPIDTFENIPTEGFVINKKVGDGNYGWNPRLAWCRLFDPRGFEFEIKIDNLIYILENANSYRGKGLEGKFIYGWCGVDMILIPENAPEYEQMMEYTDDIKTGVKKSELIEGMIYLNKKLEKLTYLGRFDEYDLYNFKNLGKKYWFKVTEQQWLNTTAGLTHLLKSTNEQDPNYSEIRAELEHNPQFSPYCPVKYQYVDATVEDLEKDIDFLYLGGIGISRVKVQYVYKNYSLLFNPPDKFRHTASPTGKYCLVYFNPTKRNYNVYDRIELKEFDTLQEMIDYFKIKIPIKYLQNGKIAKY